MDEWMNVFFQSHHHYALRNVAISLVYDILPMQIHWLPKMTSFWFHPADYAVFALTLLASLSIGVYFAVADRRKNTTEDYLLGGRKLGLVSVAISMCVSVVSSNTFLGAPAELYTYGIHYELMIFSIPIAILFVAAFVVPVFYPIKLTSKNKVRLQARSQGGGGRTTPPPQPAEVHFSMQK